MPGAVMSAVAVPLQEYRQGVQLAQSGDLGSAITVFQRVIRSGDREAAPRAARDLGLAFKMTGDPHAARSAYENAADSGHPDIAPLAARDLGLLCKDIG